MRHLRRGIVFLLAAGLLVAGVGIVLAQQPTTHPAPHPPTHPAPGAVQAPSAQNEPQRTSATYNDWVVQCAERSASPPEKICDMEQVTQVQSSGQPFSRILVPRPAKGQPTKLIVQLPVNVSLRTEVRISMGENDPGSAAPFARCVPAGCFAEFELNEDELRKFRSARGAGKLSFMDAGGHAVVVPLSFNGFGLAFDALIKD